MPLNAFFGLNKKNNKNPKGKKRCALCLYVPFCGKKRCGEKINPPQPESTVDEECVLQFDS